MNPSGVEVRPATADDVSRLVTLYRRAYAELGELGFPSSMRTVGADEVRDWLGERDVSVAVADGDVVGAVHLIPRDDWEVPELGRLAVAPDRQGRGIGARLLAHAEERARAAGWERLRLRTFGGHPFLGDWYRRAGYVQVDCEPQPDRPYDCPILEKSL